jgi:lipid A 3-O-deacylase
MRILILLLALCSTGKAQLIDNTASFRTVDADRFVRLQYENDFFTATDYYYSQGMNAEFVHPHFNNFFLSRILVSGHDAQQKGIAFEHNGFTPTSTNSDSILYGDRPFAATLTARIFSMSYHSGLQGRVTSSFTFGIIGPSAGGKAVQSTIHQWIDDDQPKGWQHQIQNDIVLKYNVGLERNLFHIPDRLLVNGLASAQVGTLNTKLTGGIVLVAGKVNAKLTNSFGAKSRYEGKRTFTFHGYCQPLVHFIAHDATLQGGLFNRESRYTVSAADLSRITLQANMGLVMQAGPAYLEYFVTFLTQEFATSLSHAWGGIRIGARW